MAVPRPAAGLALPPSLGRSAVRSGCSDVTGHWSHPALATRRTPDTAPPAHVSPAPHSRPPQLASPTADDFAAVLERKLLNIPNLRVRLKFPSLIIKWKATGVSFCASSDRKACHEEKPPAPAATEVQEPPRGYTSRHGVGVAPLGLPALSPLAGSTRSFDPSPPTGLLWPENGLADEPISTKHVVKLRLRSNTTHVKPS